MSQETSKRRLLIDGITRRRRASNAMLRGATACLAAAAGCLAFPAPAPPHACDHVMALFSAAEALEAGEHPCRAWIDMVRGRVARSGSASAVVWSRRTAFSTGILVSAAHTLGVGWFAAEGTEVTQAVHDPAKGTGIARVRLVLDDGSELDERFTPMFPLYHPTIPATENANGMRDILPRHDFYFAVIDSQKLPAAPLLETPGPLRQAPTPLYDPGMLTLTGPTFAAAVANEPVLLMGYPSSGELADLLSAGVGRVLTNDEAQAVIALLGRSGDEEGAIPYDAEAEMIIAGVAAPGMSGGGVFNSTGALLGVIVRASEARHGAQYVRAVRATFAVSELYGAAGTLPPDEQQSLARYLEPPPSFAPCWGVRPEGRIVLTGFLSAAPLSSFPRACGDTNVSLLAKGEK